MPAAAETQNAAARGADDGGTHFAWGAALAGAAAAAVAVLALRRFLRRRGRLPAG